MSWDVMVFDLGDNPPPIGEMDKDFEPRSMGAVSDVRSKISAYLPNIDWSDPTWGSYDGDGYSFEFNMGKESDTNGFMIHVRGGGDAIAALLRFSVPNKWKLFDCSTGDLIDETNPSEEGWLGFQKYRNQTIGN